MAISYNNSIEKRTTKVLLAGTVQPDGRTPWSSKAAAHAGSQFPSIGDERYVVEASVFKIYKYMNGNTLNDLIQIWPVDVEGGGVTPGDKEDITIEDENTYTINDGVVTSAKVATKAITSSKINDKAVGLQQIDAILIDEGGFLKQIPGTNTFVVINSNKEMVIQDYEELAWQPIMNVEYNAILPNKKLIIPENVGNTDTVINYLSVPDNADGLWFVQKSTKNETVLFNGQVQSTIPNGSNVAFTISYEGVSGNIIWKI